MAQNLFPERMKLARGSRGLTQLELALLIDGTRAAISHYEGGRRQPEFDVLIRIADELGVSLDYLLGRVGGEKEVVTHGRPDA